MKLIIQLIIQQTGAERPADERAGDREEQLAEGGQRQVAAGEAEQGPQVEAERTGAGHQDEAQVGHCGAREQGAEPGRTERY